MENGPIGPTPGTVTREGRGRRIWLVYPGSQPSIQLRHSNRERDVPKQFLESFSRLAATRQTSPACRGLLRAWRGDTARRLDVARSLLRARARLGGGGVVAYVILWISIPRQTEP